MDSTSSISLSQAFAHCSSTSSYWWGIVIVILVLLAGWSAIKFYFSKKFDTSNMEKAWLVITVFAIGIAIFMRPCNVAVNTSVAMAAAGHWLGY